MNTNQAALVVLSGGQDSTTCAIIARKLFKTVHAISFDYGQRHDIELSSAQAVAKGLNLDSHEILHLPSITLKSSSPLVSENKVETYSDESELPDGVASTFVPGRNALFLTLAFNRAVELGCTHIYTGVNQTDSSGYPDCRYYFIGAMEEALNVGVFGALDEDTHIRIETPLMSLTKAETVRLALEHCDSEAAFGRIFEHTHTCYQGVKGGCGKCAACLLRDKGFEEAGIDDPIWKFRAN